jgi:uncharacterized protein
MLLSFRFANHRSFRDEQQLNLTPVYDTADGEMPDQPAVRVVGIFGANASGKSNALNALTYMRRFALRSDREVEPGVGIARAPFKLAPRVAAEPSRYVVDLLLDGVRHTYGFTIDDERVLEEWLYQYPHNRQRKIFEREGGDYLWGEESAKRKDLNRVAEITAPTALLLSTLARFNLSGESSPDTPEHAVYLWFRRIYVDSSEKLVGGDAQFAWAADTALRDVVIGLLQAADVGITDIAIKSPGHDLEAALNQESIPQFDRHLPPSTRSKPTEEQIPLITVGRSQSQYVQLVGRWARGRAGIRVQFVHSGATGDVAFDLVDESTGTQRLLTLASNAVQVLACGGLMTVDEIDASLHPMLTARLIGLFQSATTNSAGAQLIFTSHDASLLGTFDAEEVLQRDQVWFTEKGDEGASALFPLSEFKPRKEGENRQRRYLNGNYGAIPDLSKDLFEQALLARGDLDGEQAR